MKKIFYVLLIIFTSYILFADEVQVERIEITGNERITQEIIILYSKLKVGKEIKESDIDLAVKNLYKTKLFAYVSATINKEKVLIIKVKENPLLNAVILQGNKLFSNKELLANIVQSKPLNIFNETKLNSDLVNLLTTYRNNGKIGAKVNYELITLDSNRVNLIFKICEGKTSRVKSIRFIGNNSFSDNELNKVIQLNNKSIFTSLLKLVFKGGNYYSPQYLLVNTELLDHFYSSHGYIDNHIQPIVEIDNDYQVHITFLINEEKQFLFGSDKIIMAPEVFDLGLEKELNKFILKKNNQIFNKTKVNHVLDEINQYLNTRGYIFAKVNPEYLQHENVIDVTYNIFPGKKTYINQITINGNNRTLDKIIRGKLSTVEGDPYDILEIQKSRRRILSTDFFSSVKINNYPISDGAVDLEINVKERGTGTFSLAGGLSFPGDAFFKTDIKEPNLLGTGKELSFSLEKSQNSFLTDIEVIENNFNYSDTSIGAGVFYEKRKQANTDFTNQNMGFSSKLSYKVTDNLTHSLRYLYKYGKTSRKDQEDDKRIISSIGYTLAYSTLDNLYSPRNGYLLRLSQDLSGLGGNVDFLKSEFLSFITRPILSNFDDDIILRFKAAAGYIFSYSNKPLGVEQHFFKGSNEIRGFDLSGIGPRDNNGNSLGGKFYFNATQQIDFPLPKIYEQSKIKGSLFIDYATLFGLDCGDNRCGDMHQDNRLLRISAGFGFSIPFPLGGRLRLDFGFPLKKEHYDRMPSPEHIKFSIETGI